MRSDEFFRELVRSQKSGSPQGICGVCSAHPIVLEAAFEQARRDGLPVLIESTVNQVNQFGGYTGMDPQKFRQFVHDAADRLRFPRDRIMLGADHLGPYPWRTEPRDAAMAKARDLARLVVRAGYSKLHLDASMLLGGDSADKNGGLDAGEIASREAELVSAAEEAYQEHSGSNRDCPPLTYVIGTEVPPPGGQRSESEAQQGDVAVTRVEDLQQTVSLCEEAFRRRGLAGAWERVRAVVAQPGVEFGDADIHDYDRDAAASLCAAAHRIPGIILEGHSTDYQSRERLRQLVLDGVGILKVGPALTFALRECLFSLECVERELSVAFPDMALSELSAALESAMLVDPSQWESYYQGTTGRQKLSRRFSFSDRCRYYWTGPAVERAVQKLLENLGRTGVPLSLLSQYLPAHFRAFREGRLETGSQSGPAPSVLLRESVRRVLEDYSFAVRPTPPSVIA